MARPRRINIKPTTELIADKVHEIESTEMKLLELRSELKELEAQLREEQIAALVKTVEENGLTLEEAIKRFAEKE